MHIGLKIKKIREKNNISQATLAKKIKTLDQSQICKIENGKLGIKVNEVVGIAKVLNIPLKEMLMG